MALDRFLTSGLLGLLGLVVATTALSAVAGVEEGTGNARIYGIEVITDTLPFYDGRITRDPRPTDHFPPLRMLLSRYRYWSADPHLDVVVQLEGEAVDLAGTRISGTFRGEDGGVLSTFVFVPPAAQFIFYPQVPAEIAKGGHAELELKWLSADGAELGSGAEAFRVQWEELRAPSNGRVELAVPNADGVVEARVPVTLGVPFPRGVLWSTDNLRLVDEAGREHPVQVDERARWSRYGSLKWILCDFTVDLDGAPLRMYLEYGPAVERGVSSPIRVVDRPGFPLVDAGRVRIDDGVWYDASGSGAYTKVLDAVALSGAYVEHENGIIYRMATDGDYEVEELGAEKVVIRRSGWLHSAESERPFCQYIVRYVIHRDSPLVRVFYSWIFTGNGNRDRILAMGWELPLASDGRPGGFLTAFGEDGEWLEARSLLQWDYDQFDLEAGGEILEVDGGRSPGVALVRADGVNMYFGAKDFWQNFPSQLEFGDDSLWFNNWPRGNRPVSYQFDIANLGERGDASEREFHRNLVRASFAHQGEALDFRLPDVLAEEPVWGRVTRGRSVAEMYWRLNDPESTNAQGISRTEEFWLYFTPDDTPRADAAAVLESLNEERLRAFADPVWVAASGAFYEMHHQDRENFPEAERIFELMAIAPYKWIEWLEFYGMWNYGDFAAWGGLSDTPSLYRARRKRHHGWPISWVPFARSGDARLLKLAEASTRQMIDANFCHYVDDDAIVLADGSERFVGMVARSPIAWAGKYAGPSIRNYDLNVDFNLHAYYLTGYERSWDNLEVWAAQTKVIGDRNNRGFGPGEVAGGPYGHRSAAQLKDWVEWYEASFDPWFIVAARGLAQGLYDIYLNSGRARGPGHTYSTADREYLRYTGCPVFEEYYMAYRDYWGDHRVGSNRGGVEPTSYGWLLDGDEYSLARVANWVEYLTHAVNDGEDAGYAQGTYLFGHTTVIFHGYVLDYFPTALATLAMAESIPEPIGSNFELRLVRQSSQPEFVLRKLEGEPLRIVFNEGSGRVNPDAFSLAGPDGEPFTPRVDEEDAQVWTVPAAAPTGDYRLRTSASRFEIPFTDAGQPEVMVIERGGELPGSYGEGRYWFMVPDGVSEFSVTIPATRGRTTVWGPDGDKVWNLSSFAGTDSSVTAVITVEPDQAGRLWRITYPFLRGRGPIFDEQIPPVFATDKSRWFEAE